MKSEEFAILAVLCGQLTKGVVNAVAYDYGDEGAATLHLIISDEEGLNHTFCIDIRGISNDLVSLMQTNTSWNRLVNNPENIERHSRQIFTLIDDSISWQNNHGIITIKIGGTSTYFLIVSCIVKE